MPETPLTHTQSAATETIFQLEGRHLVQVYRRAPVVFVRGKGVRLYDLSGRAYLDLISGVGVASLGHGHPGLCAAIAAQAESLLHTSNLFYHPLQGELAARLAQMSGLPRAFFCNSGAEAVEACLKFVRRYWHARNETGRTRIVALEGSFHGRTCGALSVTWDEHYRLPFAPLLPDVVFVSPTDPDALRAAVSPATAAVILEPIQGEGGVRPLDPGFAAAVRDGCAATGALLVADEVQCGLGRTGQPFHFSTLGLRPDLVAVGKSLGGGVPIGAALASERTAAALAAGDHGSTYGGNLLACRAALVFLDRLIDGGLLGHVQRMGRFLGEALSRLPARHATIRDVRGAGLMWGIDLSGDAAPVVDEARRRGLLVNRTAGSVIRLLPPLIIEQADLEEALEILDVSFAAVGAQVAR